MYLKANKAIISWSLGIFWMVSKVLWVDARLLVYVKGAQTQKSIIQISSHRFSISLKMVTWICIVDQPKAVWFESDLEDFRNGHVLKQLFDGRLDMQRLKQ